MITRNLTALTDYYQLTMMQGYHSSGIADRLAVFDLFYRRNPSENGYAIAAGLAQAIEYITGLEFTDRDINFLKRQGVFSDGFLEYLRGFKFTGDIHAVPEGTVVFPHEPILRVKAPVIQAQFLETALLNIINHQSLIATKAARIAEAAAGDLVIEMGLRRAQGPDSSVYGARAAIIGGCSATSNVLAAEMFDVPVRGTQAHSWVMSFEDELTAFREYAKTFPDNCVLVVDTYDTLRSGVPNAIKIFGELREQNPGFKNYGIRLDSGDFAYLSKKARKMLDEAGFPDALIGGSSDLNELLIRDLKLQGSAIKLWGVGTNLITSGDWPAFGGVYKLAAAEDDSGMLQPKIKLSDNVEKITNPGIKKIHRFYDAATGKIKADLIALEHEKFDPANDQLLFDPNATWKRMTLPAFSYRVRELLTPVFVDGHCVYTPPPVMDIQAYCASEKATLWDEHRRLINPHVLPVDLSEELWELKERMIQELR
ncbi:MAG: nicotinate phosphoribosyltransferase [Defluviitaleaceae bacterium]|nr:nicotinate phosphoribosyltransferase [Defluviitaleaceae bacterium]